MPDYELGRQILRGLRRWWVFSGFGRSEKHLAPPTSILVKANVYRLLWDLMGTVEQPTDMHCFGAFDLYFRGGLLQCSEGGLTRNQLIEWDEDMEKCRKYTSLRK